jgi:hypothetical protein
MFALVLNGSNGEIISRHRTIEAAAKKYAKLQREAKQESSLAYVPADLRRLLHGRPEMMSGDQFKQWDEMKKALM